MRELYPPIEPYREGTLKVSDLHTIHFEESGNPHLKPLVVLHGGPGGGCPPFYRQYFDPNRWRVVMFDQRGCGRSTPHAELRENTTWDLVNDIEKLRAHLNIEQWVVFGGSWGSTLSLAYSQTYPERCRGLILRGIFLLRQKELRWFYQEGASYLFPDAWEDYVRPIPPPERHDMLAAYYKRLTSSELQTRLEAARAWSIWEATTSRLFVDPGLKQIFGESQFADAFARIECHYFINKGFLEQEEQLLLNVDRIRHIPTVIVQGRYDVVCPIVSAWELHCAWPEAEFIVVPDAWKLAEPLAVGGVAVETLEQLTARWANDPTELRDLGLRWLALSFDVMSMITSGLRGAERIAELVHSMKSYSHLDQGTQQIVDVHEGLEDTLRLFSCKLKHGIEIQRSYDRTLPKIWAYGSELNQVWTNLIDNAIDAMNETGVLELKTMHHDEHIKVQIIDSGAGISEQVRARIFEPFFTTKPVGKGSGLGLEVVRRIVENRHQGTISVESKPGKTQFTVCLPTTANKRQYSRSSIV